VSSAEDHYRKDGVRRQRQQDKQNAAERAKAEKLARELNKALPKLVIYLTDNPTSNFKWIAVGGEEIVGWRIGTTSATPDGDELPRTVSEYYLLSTGEVIDQHVNGSFREITINADMGLRKLSSICWEIRSSYHKHQSTGKRILLGIFAPKKVFPHIPAGGIPRYTSYSRW
jgi:hypothetical protein